MSLRNQSADWLWQSHGTTLYFEIPTPVCATFRTDKGRLYLKVSAKWGLLVAEPAFAFAGTRNRSVTVRSGEDEPPFCQYGGRTVAAVRQTENLLCVCVHARPFFKESLIISSAVAVGSFVPTLRFETLEIHKVCLRISNLDLCQNPSSSTLAEITSDSSNAKTPELTPRG